MKYGSFSVKRHQTTGSNDVCLTMWHSDLSRCKSFADRNGLPMVAVWSNGSACGHCVTLANAVKHSAFVNFQKTYKVVWCFVESSDANSGVGSVPCRWCRGENTFNQARNKNLEQITGYPFVTFWWKKAKFDFWCTGDKLDKQRDGKTGANNCISFIKNKFKNVFSKYKYNPNA